MSVSTPSDQAVVDEKNNDNDDKIQEDVFPVNIDEA